MPDHDGNAAAQPGRPERELSAESAGSYTASEASAHTDTITDPVLVEETTEFAAARQERRQLAALARSVSSGDANQVLQAARDAVGEWDQAWPDNWRLWQDAYEEAAR